MHLTCRSLHLSLSLSNPLTEQKNIRYSRCINTRYLIFKYWDKLNFVRAKYWKLLSIVFVPFHFFVKRSSSVPIYIGGCWIWLQYCWPIVFFDASIQDMFHHFCYFATDDVGTSDATWFASQIVMQIQIVAENERNGMFGIWRFARTYSQVSWMVAVPMYFV